MVRFAAAIIVEGESTVSRVRKVVATNPITRRSFGVDGSKGSSIILEDPNGAEAWPVENEMVRFATAVIVEGERLVGGVRQVVAADPTARRSLGVNWRELPTIVP